MSNSLYTAKELAKILKVHPKTIYRAAERGEIESYRIGKSIRFVNPAESERNRTNDEQTNTERSGNSVHPR